MRAYDGIKAERGRRVSLETPDFLEHARRLLASNIHLEIRMSGSSMQPAIVDGDVITIEPVSDTPIRPGDVVLYASRRDTAVIHRVIRIERSEAERLVITRGDAAFQNDPPIPLSKIMGRVQLVERGGEAVEIRRPKSKLALALLGFIRRLRFRPK
ncbi:MAG TPA: signal peptidase I [Blastocatellia bacterium]|nr:signal peptidase I [Blastocatellia bacterium]